MSLRGIGGAAPWRAASAALFFAALAAPGGAHVFYLEPSTLTPAPGERVSLSLFVGDPFVGEPVPRMASLMLDFRVWDEAGESAPVEGVLRVHPAGFLIYDGTPRVVSYRGTPQPLELEAGRFSAYLLDEGQESALGEWRRAPAPAGFERELFSRCAKAVLGPPSHQLLSRSTGCELEIGAGSGDGRLALLFRGKPLSGNQVQMWSGGRPFQVLSDEDGEFELPASIDPEKMLVVHSVLVERASQSTNPRSQRSAGGDSAAELWESWRSWWSSLTFLPGRIGASGRLSNAP